MLPIKILLFGIVSNKTNFWIECPIQKSQVRHRVVLRLTFHDNDWWLFSGHDRMAMRSKYTFLDDCDTDRQCSSTAPLRHCCHTKMWTKSGVWHKYTRWSCSSACTTKTVISRCALSRRRAKYRPFPCIFIQSRLIFVSYLLFASVNVYLSGFFRKVIKMYIYPDFSGK